MVQLAEEVVSADSPSELEHGVIDAAYCAVFHAKPYVHSVQKALVSVRAAGEVAAEVDLPPAQQEVPEQRQQQQDLSLPSV